MLISQEWELIQPDRGAARARLEVALTARAAGEKHAGLARKLGQLPPFIAAFHRNAWADLHLLGQATAFPRSIHRTGHGLRCRPNTFLADSSKPIGGAGGAYECWSLLSTRAFGTKHKCPQHPNYVAPKPRRRDRSDSYECPF